MSFGYSKGPTVQGDITGADDADRNTKIDFEEDQIKLVTSGSIRINISGSNGEVKFNEAYTFPISDGSANQVLKTNGSGQLSWTDQSGGGGGGGASSLNDLSDVSFSSGNLQVGSMEKLTGTRMTIDSADATAAGSGFSNAAKCETKIIKLNHYILTTIAVDLEGILTMGEAGQVLGNAGGPANAYLTKISTASSGFIYRAEMACVETPVNGAQRIDLVADPTARAAGFEFDTVATEKYILVPGATWHAGEEEKSINGAGTVNAIPYGLDNYYLYLCPGVSDHNWSNVYSAGKFIIKLYGATF